MQSEPKFELHAIVELFGHQKMAGMVCEETIGGATMIRIDVPETKLQPKFTRFMHINAIYAINPVTEEVANAMANRINSKPIDVWDAREVLRRADEQKKLTTTTTEEEEELEEEGNNDDLPY